MGRALSLESGTWLCIRRCAVAFEKCECDCVHAVAQSSWRWSVVEYVSKMRAAARTRYFHSKDCRKRAAFVYRFFADRLPETRPAGTGIEFCLGAVERIAARGANVNAFAMIERVTAGRRTLSACSTHHVKLERRHDELPLAIRKIDFLIDRNSIQF